MHHVKPRYPVEEALQLLGLPRSTGYNTIKSGHLKIQKDGRRTFITAVEIDRYVQDVGAAPQSAVTLVRGRKPRSPRVSA